MCGIFGYLNNLVPRDRAYIINILVNGLKRLEYRGYDSAGMAIDGDVSADKPNEVVTAIIKKQGKVAALEAQAASCGLDMSRVFEKHLGIAHTRWATHGPPNEVNSHPHTSDKNNEFVIIHNGIITNCKEIKTLLQAKGYEFISETDTECIAKLIKYFWDQAQASGQQLTFRELVEETILELQGAYALIFKSTHFPDEMIATRRGSPLLIGIRTESGVSRLPVRVQDYKHRPLTVLNESGTSVRYMDFRRESVDEGITSNIPVEYFVASDASAIIEHTRQVLFLEDGDVAEVRGGALNIHHVKPKGEDSPPTPSIRDVKTLEMELQQIMKGSYAHYMLKEIFEQPESVVNTMRGRVNFETGIVRLGGLEDRIKDFRRCRRLMFIACGTSYNSAVATRQFLEEMTEMPVIVDIASDFLDRSPPIFRDDVCFFISQSGETADTISALRYCKEHGAIVVGVTNTVGSTISRETDCGVHINAGPEIGVASTKAYTSQMLTLVLFGLMMAQDTTSKDARRREIVDALQELPSLISRVLSLNDSLKSIALDLHKETSLLVMGRGYNFANCLEGALKIKELTYMHSEGILAGELKHGPLALIDHTMPIIMIMMQDKTIVKSQNALEQIVARHGNPIIICSEGHKPKAGTKDLRTIEVPSLVDCLQGVLTVIPLQLLSYHIATARGYDVDCPRNLAKSVTVE